jgi:hypothetical protein
MLPTPLVRVILTVLVAVAALTAGGSAAQAVLPDDENGGSACLPPECASPEAPTGFRIATGTSRSLTLEWSFRTGDAVVLRRRELPYGGWIDAERVDFPDPGPMAFVDTSVQSGTGYCYHAAARTELGTTVLEGTSETACGSPADGPPAAAAVTLQSGFAAMRVTWPDLAGGEQGSWLERRLASEPSWTFVERFRITGRGTVSHYDNGLWGETAYCYRVATWNFHGVTHGPEACATTQQPLGGGIVVDRESPAPSLLACTGVHTLWLGRREPPRGQPAFFFQGELDVPESAVPAAAVVTSVRNVTPGKREGDAVKPTPVPPIDVSHTDTLGVSRGPVRLEPRSQSLSASLTHAFDGMRVRRVWTGTVVGYSEVFLNSKWIDGRMVSDAYYLLELSWSRPGC